MDIVRSEAYTFPDRLYNLFMYVGLQGLFAEWKFTVAGHAALDAWMDTVDDASIDDSRRLVLEASFLSVMQSLVGSGDAWRSKEEPYVHATWWEDLGPLP